MAGTSNAYPELERDLSFHPASNTDPQKLSRQQIRQFNDKGYISPLDVFSPEEADAPAVAPRNAPSRKMMEMPVIRQGMDMTVN